MIQATLAERLAANGALTVGESAVEVIVPVHDARDETVRCLEALASSTRSPFSLCVVDDGSTDPDLAALLATLDEVHPAIHLIARRSSGGFVASVNEAMQRGRSDVVLLNSDTVVPPRWLERLREVAAAAERIASVTPLSNNGTLCSVPRPWVDNRLPSGHDVTSFDALCHELSPRTFPDVPTGVGFCMYISRSALDEVGPFDEAAFGRGYGEENDFCQRARRLGYSNRIADICSSITPVVRASETRLRPGSRRRSRPSSRATRGIGPRSRRSVTTIRSPSCTDGSSDVWRSTPLRQRASGSCISCMLGAAPRSTPAIWPPPLEIGDI